MNNDKEFKSCVIGIAILDGLIKDNENCPQEYKDELVAGVSNLIMNHFNMVHPLSKSANKDMEMFHINDEIVSPELIEQASLIMGGLTNRLIEAKQLVMDEKALVIFKNITAKILEELKILSIGIRQTDKDVFASISVSLSRNDFDTFHKYLSEKSEDIGGIWTVMLDTLLNTLGYRLNAFAVSSLSSKELSDACLKIVDFGKMPKVDDIDIDAEYEKLYGKSDEIPTLLN